MILALNFVLLLFSIVMLKRSVVFFFPLFYSFIYVYTSIGHYFFNYAVNIPFSSQFYWPGLDISIAGKVYSLASLSFIAGYFFRMAFKYDILKVETKAIMISSRLSLIFVCFVISMYLMAIDWNFFFYRDSYIIPKTFPVFYMVFKFLVPIASFLLPFISSKYYRYTLFLVLWILPFSINSRTMCLIPFLYIVGLCLSNRNNLKFKVFILSLFTILSLGIALGYRHNDSQGLIPNLIYLINNGVPFDVILKSINYVTSYSVYITTYGINEQVSDFYAFIISINPLPSRFLNIGYLLDNSMLNSFVPSPAIAMVYSQGFFIFLFYYFFIGFCFTHVYPTFLKNNMMYIYVGFLIVFCFFNSQYILRESVRFFYYLLFFYLVVNLFVFFKKEIKL